MPSSHNPAKVLVGNEVSEYGLVTRKTTQPVAAALVAGTPESDGPGTNETQGVFSPGTFLQLPTQTSGTLIYGQQYTITTYVAGDDFISVGAANNVSGTVFYATAITPAVWTNGSTLTATGVPTGGDLVTVKHDQQDTQMSQQVIDRASKVVLDAFVYQSQTKARVTDIPAVLTSVAIVWQLSTGSGSHSEGSYGVNNGASAQLSVDSRGSGRGSAAVIPEITPAISKVDESPVVVTDYYFLLPNSVTVSAILTKLNAIIGTTVADKPNFKPNIVTVYAQGQSMSLDADAAVGMRVYSNSDGGNGFTQNMGLGWSNSIDNHVRAITLPETIHGTINLNGGTIGTSTSQNVSAIAIATMQNGGGAFDTMTAEIVMNGAALGLTATASYVTLTLPSSTGPGTQPPLGVTGRVSIVSPSGTEGTSIAPSTGGGLPSSGLFLDTMDVKPYEPFGGLYSFVRARVANWADLQI